jgi:hypothetical protein
MTGFQCSPKKGATALNSAWAKAIGGAPSVAQPTSRCNLDSSRSTEASLALCRRSFHPYKPRVPGTPAGCPILRVFCEGWDTTNLDTDRRVSHPLQRTQRMGHPPIRGASCRAKHQPRLNRELVIRKPHTRSCLMLHNRKSGYAGANEGHPPLLSPHRGAIWTSSRSTEASLALCRRSFHPYKPRVPGNSGRDACAYLAAAAASS